MTERRGESPHFRAWRHVAFVALFVVAFAPTLQQALQRQPLSFAPAAAPSPAAQPNEVPAFEERFVFHQDLTSFAHSPALAEIADGRLLAIWYGGSREGAPDVSLYGSRFDPAEENWTTPEVVTTPSATQREIRRYVRTLGNPALWSAPDGQLWLFYVASPAGWAASSIHVKTSQDGGTTWTPAWRLVTSPYFNMGTLVRTSPLRWGDGTIALPAYQELLGIFPELMRISTEGIVLERIRIGQGKRALQPAVVALSDRRAIALLRWAAPQRPKRYREREARTLFTQSSDGGRSWTLPAALQLENPGSSVAVLRLSDGRLLAAFNRSQRGRNNLSLALSRSAGASWEVVASIEDDEAGGQFAYPTLIQATNRQIHLVYAWNYRRIKHVEFNEAWVRAQSP